MDLGIGATRAERPRLAHQRLLAYAIIAVGPAGRSAPDKVLILRGAGELLSLPLVAALLALVGSDFTLELAGAMWRVAFTVYCGLVQRR